MRGWGAVFQKRLGFPPRPGFRRDGLIGPPCNAVTEIFSGDGQDLLGVEAQEPRLLGAGSMEDEMAEAEIDVKLDLFDLLVRVARHDPTAGGALDYCPRGRRWRSIERSARPSVHDRHDQIRE